MGTILQKRLVADHFCVPRRINTGLVYFTSFTQHSVAGSSLFSQSSLPSSISGQLATFKPPKNNSHGNLIGERRIPSMAFLLPKISPSPSLPHTKTSQNAPLPAPLIKLSPPPPRGNLTAPLKQQKQPLPTKPPNNDFYLNLGVAVRTLRSDLPSLFSRDLDYNIYRDDITFIDPLNTFHGIENYKFIFWALRFHGRILFSEIGVEIFRVWQPSETSILIRWELQGTPRVPWEARGRFQGTSRYKLDREGKIYEHKVDNLAFNFPRRPMTVLDLVVAGGGAPATPNLTFYGMEGGEGCSWVELYRAVRGTVDQEGRGTVGAGIEGLVVCS